MFGLVSGMVKEITKKEHKKILLIGIDGAGKSVKKIYIIDIFESNFETKR